MKTIMNTHTAFAGVVLACFALSPAVQALVPPPDGAYPGLNTAEGQSALFSLDTSTGNANTAVGWFSLKSDVNGSFNTAIGAGHCCSTLEIRILAMEPKIQPLELPRFYSIRRAPRTQPMERSHFLTTPRRASTRPRGFKRSIATPATAATTTWLLAIKRSLAIQRAAGM